MTPPTFIELFAIAIATLIQTKAIFTLLRDRFFCQDAYSNR
ncbi:MAG: hypothetical protein AB4040_10960 [Synechococcus sp.]